MLGVGLECVAKNKGPHVLPRVLKSSARVLAALHELPAVDEEGYQINFLENNML